MDTNNTAHFPEQLIWTRGLAQAAHKTWTLRPKHSVNDSARLHMQAAAKYTRLAATATGSKEIHFTRRATSHRNAANLILSFISGLQRAGNGK